MPLSSENLTQLAANIRTWGEELGFQQVGITRTDLADDEAHLARWLALGRHGRMAWMARHGTRRSRPAELVPGTLSIIWRSSCSCCRSVALTCRPSRRCPSRRIVESCPGPLVQTVEMKLERHPASRQDGAVETSGPGPSAGTAACTPDG